MWKSQQPLLYNVSCVCSDWEQLIKNQHKSCTRIKGKLSNVCRVQFAGRDLTVGGIPPPYSPVCILNDINLYTPSAIMPLKSLMLFLRLQLFICEISHLIRANVFHVEMGQMTICAKRSVSPHPLCELLNVKRDFIPRTMFPIDNRPTTEWISPSYATVCQLTTQWMA